MSSEPNIAELANTLYTKLKNRYSEAVSVIRGHTFPIVQCILSRQQIRLREMIPGSNLRWEHVIASGLIWFESTETDYDTYRAVVLIDGPWALSHGRAGRLFLKAQPKSPYGLRLGQYGVDVATVASHIGHQSLLTSHLGEVYPSESSIGKPFSDGMTQNSSFLRSSLGLYTLPIPACQLN